jgi:hypothetical protein
MPNTTTWGITYPDASSNLTPLESHFQNVATTTDTALTSLKSNIRGSDSSSTIGSLSTSVAAINTRLALNLQTSSAAPSGAPINSGVEGSMHWDSGSDALYIYRTTVGWEKVWGDTDWQNITINAGFAASTAVPQYRMIGDVVYLRGAFGATGITTANTPYTVGTIPATARPSQTIIYTGGSSSGTPMATKVSISSAGALVLTVPTTGHSYYINFTYPIG